MLPEKKIWPKQKAITPLQVKWLVPKLIERIVCSNIMSHLYNHSIITDRQHAFRKHHSFESQLCNVIHDWAKNIDYGKQTDIFILDFEKAFDTVPYELLKSKLNSYGISENTLCWIDAFLCHSKQCVVVNGYKSGWSDVKSGVPPRHCTGPGVIQSSHQWYTSWYKIQYTTLCWWLCML